MAFIYSPDKFSNICIFPYSGNMMSGGGGGYTGAMMPTYIPQYTLNVFGNSNFYSGLYLNGISVITKNDTGNFLSSNNLNGLITTGDSNLKYLFSGSSGAFYSSSNPNGFIASTSLNGLISTGSADLRYSQVKVTGSSTILSPNFTGIKDIVVYQSGNYICISGSAGTAGGGETNTASNIGEGIGTFAQKNGVDLQFYEIIAGTGMSVSQSGNNISINSKNDFTGIYLNSNLTMATANVWYDVLTGTLSPGLWCIDANVTFFRPATTLGTNTAKLWTIGFTGGASSVSFPSQANNFTSANVSVVRNVVATENWVLSCAGNITNNQVSSTGWHNVGKNATSIQAIKFR